MAYLLDTHTFLWFISGDKQLPSATLQKIQTINYTCFLSAASLWEITIKKHLGKLELAISLEKLFQLAEENQIEVFAN